MAMTILSYLVAIVATFTFFHIFVHAFDIACILLLFLPLPKVFYRSVDDRRLSHAGLFLLSAAKGFCTNVLASLIGIGIIRLFGKNYVLFPLIYFAIVLISTIDAIKYLYLPPLRVKGDIFILLGNLLAIIGVYSVVWFVWQSLTFCSSSRP